MDVKLMIDELRKEALAVDQAIYTLDKLKRSQAGLPKPRGRKPAFSAPTRRKHKPSVKADSSPKAGS